MPSVSKTSRVMKIVSIILAMGLVVVLFSVIAPTKSLDEVTFRMNWYWGGIHVPYVVAEEKGYYEEYGIDVEIVEGRGSGISTQLVGNKSNDFALAVAPIVCEAIAKGIPIKTVLIIQQDQAEGVIFLKGTDIKTAKDLEGKTIAATADGSPYKTLPAVVKKNNLDMDKINVVLVDAAAKVIAVMQGKVDALLGGISDQPSILKSKGYEPDYLLFSDMGIGAMGLTLITHTDTIRENPDLVKRFVAATTKGILETERDPEAALDVFMEAHPEREREHIRLELEKCVDVLWQLKRPDRFGYGDPTKVRAMVEMLKEYKDLETDKTWDEFHTNEFVPCPGSL